MFSCLNNSVSLKKLVLQITPSYIWFHIPRNPKAHLTSRRSSHIFVIEKKHFFLCRFFSHFIFYYMRSYIWKISHENLSFHYLIVSDQVLLDAM